MNVIIELGPADLDCLHHGWRVARAGIMVAPVGHPLTGTQHSAQPVLMLDDVELLQLRLGATLRKAMKSGERVDVRGVPR